MDHGKWTSVRENTILNYFIFSAQDSANEMAWDILFFFFHLLASIADGRTHTVDTHIHARTHTCDYTERTSFWEMYSIKYRYFPIHHVWCFFFFFFSSFVNSANAADFSIRFSPATLYDCYCYFMFFCRWEQRIWMRQKCIFAVHINRIARSSTMALVALRAYTHTCGYWVK